MRKIFTSIFCVLMLSGMYAIAQPAYVFCDNGNFRIQDGNYETAVVEFTKAIEKDKGYFKAYLGRAKANVLLGKYDEGLKDLDIAISIKPDLYEAYYEKAYVMHLQGEPKDALKQLDELIEMNPDYFEAFVLRGAIFMETGKTKNAEEAFSKASTIDPKSLKPYFARAEIYERQENWKAAILEYAAIMKLDPSNQESCYKKGLLHMKLKEWGPGSKALQEVIRRGEADEEVYKLRAECYEKDGNAEDALRDLNTYLENNECMDADVWFRRGRMNLATGNISAAINDFSKAIDIAPTRAMFEFRADAYSRINEEDLAQQDIANMRSLNTDH